MMDANADLQEKQMADFLNAHGLLDLIAVSNEGEAPGTYIRSGNRLDYILGTEHIQQAILKSGSLASHDGVSYSDHTLQFIDFDTKMLFDVEATVPFATYEREFRMKDHRKREKFLTKLHKIYEHQEIPRRVNELHEQFESQGPTPELIELYQQLDYEIVCAKKGAVNSVGHLNFGYATI